MAVKKEKRHFLLIFFNSGSGQPDSTTNHQPEYQQIRRESQAMILCPQDVSRRCLLLQTGTRVTPTQELRELRDISIPFL
jgi:hypothetical protein